MTLVALMGAVVSQATILRVNNSPGSSAQYSDVKTAIDAAAEGDTVLVEGSSTNYGKIDKLDKRIVLRGPGYWLVENGIAEVGFTSARIPNITVTSPGVVIEGLQITNKVTVKANNVVVRRCLFSDANGGLVINGAKDCVIHQNMFYRCKPSCTDFYVQDRNIQITNNIIMGQVAGFGGSYIAYNTFIVSSSTAENLFKDITYSTIEHNILPSEAVNSNGWNDTESNAKKDNVFMELMKYSEVTTDGSVKDATTTTEAGAFAGDSPYVLGGIPSGLVLQSLQAPVTIDEGTPFNVSIKVGVVK